MCYNRGRIYITHGTEGSKPLDSVHTLMVPNRGITLDSVSTLRENTMKAFSCLQTVYPHAWYRRDQASRHMVLRGLSL